jgi:phospholipid/cholesterol/gamma-HCH transport system permease protein
VIFLFGISKLASEKKIRVEKDGLPAGVRQLIDLATAMPKREDTSQSVSRAGFFARVGSDVTDFAKSAGDLVTFTGAAFDAFVRMVTGRARFRASDLRLFLQEAGAQAVPIVSLISFLVGLILAFVGILQLTMFGAEVYVADLVGIAMVREMGAIMTGIIMAGRTGAAYAAQLGTMQVNEEIDALDTLAIPPMEFLVLPRMVALAVMMPFLVLYANLMGILGGALVAVGMYNINIIVYLNRTKAAIGLNDLFIGLFMSNVQIKPLVKEIQAALISAKKAMDGATHTLVNVDGLVGERSNTRQKLNRTLDEFSAAAKSLKSLMDYLERHPESLLKGKRGAK